MKKNIYYFVLDVKTKENDIVKSLESESIYILFKDIYNKAIAFKNGRTTNLDNMYYYDFVHFDNEYMFIKIGRSNVSNSIEIRNVNTNLSMPIEVHENEKLNTIMYFYFNFNNSVAMLYSGDNYNYPTPIKDLLFNKYGSNLEDVTFANILNSDIIQKIIEKDIIGSIEFAYAIPKDTILHNDFGEGILDFSTLENQKSQTITSKVQIKRNKSAFLHSNQLLGFYNKITNKYGKNLKKFNVKAKNQNEKLEKYDLLGYRYKTLLEVDDSVFSDETKMEKILITQYEKSIHEIDDLI